MDRSEEVAIKLGRLRDMMEANGLNAVVLATQANFSWLTAGGSNHVALASETGIAPLVVTRSRQYAVTDNIEAGRLSEEELAGLDFEIVAEEWHAEALGESVRRLATGPVDTDGDWPGEAVNVSDAISKQRWELLPTEIQRYRAH